MQNKPNLNNIYSIGTYCEAKYETLLKNGRFAFLMTKEQEDLLNVINYNMQKNIRINYGLF
jgi:hypothetical protein